MKIKKLKIASFWDNLSKISPFSSLETVHLIRVDAEPVVPLFRKLVSDGLVALEAISPNTNLPVVDEDGRIGPRDDPGRTGVHRTLAHVASKGEVPVPTLVLTFCAAVRLLRVVRQRGRGAVVPRLWKSFSWGRFCERDSFGPNLRIKLNKGQM
jgi:hypothetical protein